MRGCSIQAATDNQNFAARRADVCEIGAWIQSIGCSCNTTHFKLQQHVDVWHAGSANGNETLAGDGLEEDQGQAGRVSFFHLHP